MLSTLIFYFTTEQSALFLFLYKIRLTALLKAVWLVQYLSNLSIDLSVVCPPFAAITAAYLSGIVSIYFLRTSTLMLSHAFCNSSQRLSFECTIDLSSLFSNSLDGVKVSPSFPMFQQIPSVSGSSGNSSFYGYCNGQFNKNNWNLLNMPSVLTILVTTVLPLKVQCQYDF